MKKGFTLIELLAVIAILAIILLIAVPMVLNILATSKEKAAVKSAQFAWEAAEYYQADFATDNGGAFDTAISYADFSPFLSGSGTSVLNTSDGFTASSTTGGITGTVATDHIQVSSGGTTYTCSGSTKAAITCN